jgi:inorganic pyrophosphatase
LNYLKLFFIIIVNLYNLNQPSNFPHRVNAVVEIPKGTSAKYEYSPDGYFFYDRSLSSAMVYPASYGFIPETLGDDGDALDILVYNSTPIERGTVVQCKIIGVLDMTDEGDKDYKLLGVPTSHVRRYNTLKNIDPLFLDISKNFFLHYKDLNDKQVEVYDWHEKDFAYNILQKGATTWKR